MIGRTAQQAYKMAGKFSRSSSTHSGKVAIVTASSEGYVFVNKSYICDMSTNLVKHHAFFDKNYLALPFKPPPQPPKDG